MSSALSRTEVLRSLLSFGEAALSRGRRVLRTVELVRVKDRAFEAAGTLLPAEVHSLDAVHLATAQQLGDDPEGWLPPTTRGWRMPPRSSGRKPIGLPE